MQLEGSNYNELEISSCVLGHPLKNVQQVQPVFEHNWTQLVLNWTHWDQHEKRRTGKKSWAILLCEVGWPAKLGAYSEMIYFGDTVKVRTDGEVVAKVIVLLKVILSEYGPFSTQQGWHRILNKCTNTFIVLIDRHRDDSYAHTFSYRLCY